MIQRRIVMGLVAVVMVGSVVTFTGCERPERGSSSDDSTATSAGRSDNGSNEDAETREDRRSERKAEYKTETRDYPVANFDEIDLRGAAEVHVNIGPAATLQITGTTRALKAIDVDVAGETLDINVAKGRRWFGDTGRLKIDITTPALKSFESNGAGDIEINGFAGGDHELRVSGAHNVEASGTLDQLKIELDGAGNVDFRKVIAAEAKVTVNGAGNVELHTTQALKAEVNGVGAIRYDGDPKKVESELHGLGSISPRSKPEVSVGVARESSDDKPKKELN